jgi:DNA-binding FadR family transcriptional regulator
MPFSGYGMMNGMRGDSVAIQKESLVDIAIERIKQHIQERALKPYDKFLSEGELVSQLQVSRTVVREALISLQSVGIIKIKSGGGVYIENPNLDSIKTILKHHYDTHGVRIKELIEVRKVIELGALRLMIENQVDVNFKHLAEINDSYYHTIIKKQDTRKFDRLFHQSLMKETGNETFCTFSEIINEYFSLTKIDLIEKEEAPIQSYQQHSEIIHALTNKDLPMAQESMTKHLEPIFHFITRMEEKV